jgi:hypothetical protein
VDSCGLRCFQIKNELVMQEAGYSATPLIKKLGVKPDMKILVIHEPENYAEWLGRDITHMAVALSGNPEFIHLFAKTQAVFKKEMNPVLRYCKKNTSVIIWVSWYKKNSGITTDLTENIIRDFALQNNLVDIKVCAVSNEWSGLKLVVPVSER